MHSRRPASVGLLTGMKTSCAASDVPCTAGHLRTISVVRGVADEVQVRQGHKVEQQRLPPSPTRYGNQQLPVSRSLLQLDAADELADDLDRGTRPISGRPHVYVARAAPDAHARGEGAIV